MDEFNTFYYVKCIKILSIKMRRQLFYFVNVNEYAI